MPCAALVRDVCGMCLFTAKATPALLTKSITSVRRPSVASVACRRDRAVAVMSDAQGGHHVLTRLRASGGHGRESRTRPTGANAVARPTDPVRVREPGAVVRDNAHAAAPDAPGY